MKMPTLLRSVALSALCASASAVCQAATQYSYGFENLAPSSGSYTSTLAAQWPEGIRTFTSGSENNLSISSTSVHSGTRAIKMYYKAGYWSTVKGQFYAWATKRANYTLSYYMKFQSDFDFGKGAKLPGLGGEGSALGSYANGCDADRGSAWSTRYMWREGGRIKGYVYHADRPDDCGDYKDTGWDAPKGSWFELRQKVITNTANNNNGTLTIWCAGVQKFTQTNLRYTSTGKQIDQVFFSTFFGGSDSSWASPKSQGAWFDDFSLTYP